MTAMPTKAKLAAAAVAALRHKDKRANIPTEELRDFVAEEEEHPKVMLYPRDPSPDPQLVWKGEDEQEGAQTLVCERVRGFLILRGQPPAGSVDLPDFLSPRIFLLTNGAT